MSTETKIKELEGQAANHEYNAKNNITYSKKDKEKAREAAREKRAQAARLKAQSTDSNNK
jgi:hypothetical protein